MTAPLDLYTFDVYALSASTRTRGGTIAHYRVQASDRAGAVEAAQTCEAVGAAPHALLRLQPLPSPLRPDRRRWGV